MDEFPVSGFLQDFFLQDRRPSFTYIAPGIRVPSSEWIRQMLSQARQQGRLQEPMDPESNYDTEELCLSYRIGVCLDDAWGPTLMSNHEIDDTGIVLKENR